MPFSVAELPADLRQSMVQTGTWKETGPVSLDRLRLLTVSYFDFAGNEHHNGQIAVLDAAAPSALAVFRILHAQNFPIAKMRSVHFYQADDVASMEDNNTSCFCDRPIEGTTLTSLHSYGLAIDLNPLQNPFIYFDEENGKATIYPKAGWEYVNRHNKKAGMIEDVVALFAEHGFFIWGGRWTTPIDFHHVQPPRGVAEMLLHMTLEDGMKFFEICATYRTQLTKMPYGEALNPVIELYSESPANFGERFIDYLPELNRPA